MAAQIIPFPSVEKSTDVLRDAIQQLHPSDLLPVAGNLVHLAIEASEGGGDADFYDRAKAAYLALERVLVEGARI